MNTDEWMESYVSTYADTWSDLDLIDVTQLCALLKVKKSWVYDAVERGDLPTVRLRGRQLRFKRVDIARFLESCAA